MKTSFILLYILVLALPYPVSYGQKGAAQPDQPVSKRQNDTGKKALQTRPNRVSGASHTVNAAICEGQTYILGQRSLTTGGQYQQHFRTRNGDSMVTVNLAVYSNVLANDHLTVNADQLPLNWNDIIIPAGAHSDPAFAIYNTYNSNGCDSIVTLNLTVIDKSSHQGEVQVANNPMDIPKEHFSDNNIAPTQNGLETIVNVDVCKGSAWYFRNKLYNKAGTYTTTFKSETGADSVVLLQLNIHDRPDVNIMAKASGNACSGEDLTFFASGAEHYKWFVDERNTFIGPVLQQTLTEGSHELILTGKDRYGCENTASLLINVGACNQIRMPGSFSPGGQNMFHTFKPIEPVAEANCIMQLYNQWGAEVCTVRNINEGWNGNYSNGLPAAAGIYYYTFSCEGASRTKFLRRGKVALVR